MKTMRLPTAAIAMLAVAGCATPARYMNDRGEVAPQQVIAECEYEASKATAAIVNGIEAGWQKGTITRQCLQLKGYTLRRAA